MRGRKKADKLAPSLCIDLRGFRVLFWRGPGGRRDELADRAAGGRSYSFHRMVCQARSYGSSRPELVEPLSAIDRRDDRSRNWDGAGGSRAPAPSSGPGRELLELCGRGHPGRVFLHPKLVGGSGEWISALGDSHDQRILPDRAALGNGSEQIAPGLRADNRRLSFHPVRTVSSLMLGRALPRPSLWRPETATASAQPINPRSASSSKAASITCSTSTGASLSMRSRGSWGRRGTRPASTLHRLWGRSPARLKPTPGPSPSRPASPITFDPATMALARAKTVVLFST